VLPSHIPKTIAVEQIDEVNEANEQSFTANGQNNSHHRKSRNSVAPT